MMDHVDTQRNVERSYRSLFYLLATLAMGILIIDVITYHIRPSFFLDLAVMCWITLPVGIGVVSLLPQAIRPKGISFVAVGCAVGLTVVPLLFVTLRVFSLWQYSFAVISAINLCWGFYYFFRKRPAQRSRSINWEQLLHASVIVVLVLVTLTIYNYWNFHVDASGDLQYRSWFGADLPYFMGVIPAIRDQGYFLDLHQLALPFVYHDFIYLWLGIIARASHSDMLTLIGNSAPLFTYLCTAFTLYGLCVELTSTPRAALFVVVAWFFTGSFVGTEQGTSALSISYVAGNALLFAIITVTTLLLKQPKNVFSGYLLLLLLLIGLLRIKIPTFLMVIATIGLLILLLSFQREWKKSRAFALLMIICLIVLVLTSGERLPLRPAGDFIVGAPLHGYANHLAAFLHIPVSSIDPVATPSEIGIKQLLIIPYWIFHFFRFAIFDGRVWIIIVGLLLLRATFFSFIIPNRSVKDLAWALLLTIPIGSLLPALYSPTWYPLAISFYTLLTGTAIALIISVLFLWSLWENPKASVVLKTVTVILLIGCVVGNANAILTENRAPTTAIPTQLIDGLRYVRDHSSFKDVVASDRFDLDTAAADNLYFFYSGFTERPVIIEGAEYGALLGALQTVDTTKHLRPVQAAVDTFYSRHRALDTIYHSTSVEQVRNALDRYGVTFILEDHTINSSLAIQPDLIADRFYSNPAITVWKYRKVETTPMRHTQ